MTALLVMVLYAAEVLAMWVACAALLWVTIGTRKYIFSLRDTDIWNFGRGMCLTTSCAAWRLLVEFLPLTETAMSLAITLIYTGLILGCYFKLRGLWQSLDAAERKNWSWFTVALHPHRFRISWRPDVD